MEKLTPGWKITGTYNEACASEGHCPYYFGRDVEEGCRYFMVFRIKKGCVNDIDLSGIAVVYNGNIRYPKFEDFMQNGSEGSVYVSHNAIDEQRKVLDTLVTTNIGANFMKTIFEVKYEQIETSESDGSFHIKTPFGVMKQNLMKGIEGEAIRIENCALPNLKKLKVCHTSFWRYRDHRVNFSYKHRCGTWGDFVFEG